MDPTLSAVRADDPTEGPAAAFHLKLVAGRHLADLRGAKLVRAIKKRSNGVTNLSTFDIVGDARCLPRKGHRRPDGRWIADRIGLARNQE